MTNKFEGFENGLFHLPNGKDQDPVPVPLQDVSAHIHVGDFKARVEVVQTYENKLSDSLETIFLNPIAEGVHMLLVFEVLIDGEKEVNMKYHHMTHRKMAEELREENAMIRTGNLNPKSIARVRIEYLVNLAIEDDVMRFIPPMIVPRYGPLTEEQTLKVAARHSVPVKIIVQGFQKCKDWKFGMSSNKFQIQCDPTIQQAIITGDSVDVEYDTEFQVKLLETSKQLPTKLETLLLEDDSKDETLFRELDVGLYLEEKNIGGGAFGKVYAYKHKHSHEALAIKHLNIKELPPSLKRGTSPKDIPDKLKRLKNYYYEEIKAMLSFQHPNLLPSVGICKINDKVVGIFTPLCSENLDGFISKAYEVKRTLNFNQFLHILTEMIKGIENLHDKGIIHRDIKPENILLTSPSGIPFEDALIESLSVQIADFGLCKPLCELETQIMSIVGTESYMAPELRYSKENHHTEGKPSAEYGSKADIYSFGRVAKDLEAILQSDDTSIDPLKEVLNSCTKDENFRPDAKGILEAIKDVKSGKSELATALNLGKGNIRYTSAPESRQLFKIEFMKTKKELKATFLDFYESVQASGSESLETANVELKLAKQLRNVKKFDEALEHGEHVVDVREKKLGGEDVTTLEAKHELGILYQEMHEKDAAKNLQEKVAKQRVQHLGETAVDTIQSKQELAYTYGRLRWHGKALELQREILDMKQNQLKERPVDTIQIRQHMAFSLKHLGINERDEEKKQNYFTEATTILDEVLQMKEEQYKKEKQKLDVLHTKHDLAKLHFVQENYSNAKKLLLEVLKERKEKLGPNHITTIAAKEDLALTLAELEEFENALSMMQDVYNARVAQDEEIKKPITKKSKKNLERIKKMKEDIGV